MARARSIGLIAGQGALPALASALLMQGGLPFAVFGFEGMDAALDVPSENRLPLGALDALRSRFRAEEVDQVLIVGRFDLAWLAPAGGAVEPDSTRRVVPDATRPGRSEPSPVQPDAEALALLSRLDRLDGVTLMSAIADWLTAQGLELLAQDSVLAPMMMVRGVISQRAPSSGEFDSVAPALAVLAHPKDGSLAQSVAVLDGKVVRLEDGAGTDAMIARAGEAGAGPGLTIVKAARPGQDRRLDLPAVGVETIKAMQAAGATALALEAGSVLVLDYEALRAAADRAEIAVWGFERGRVEG
jgi:DUF1009 family protein